MSVNSRFHRLTRLHRRIDDALRVENERRRGGDGSFRRLRLHALRASVKARLAALMRRPAFAR
jgi:hypothetical protein